MQEAEEILNKQMNSKKSMPRCMMIKEEKLQQQKRTMEKNKSVAKYFHSALEFSKFDGWSKAMSHTVINVYRINKDNYK